MVISSRKQQNVDRAVATLKEEGLSVTGTVCHVGKAEDREQLVATVRVQGSSFCDPHKGNRLKTPLQDLAHHHVTQSHNLP